MLWLCSILSRLSTFSLLDLHLGYAGLPRRSSHSTFMALYLNWWSLDIVTGGVNSPGQKIHCRIPKLPYLSKWHSLSCYTKLLYHYITRIHRQKIQALLLLLSTILVSQNEEFRCEGPNQPQTNDIMACSRGRKKIIYLNSQPYYKFLWTQQTIYLFTLSVIGYIKAFKNIVATKHKKRLFSETNNRHGTISIYYARFHAFTQCKVRRH